MAAKQPNPFAVHTGEEAAPFVEIDVPYRERSAHSASKLRTLAEKVLNVLREPFQIAGHQHFATPSIGATSFNGDQSDVSELLKQADLAHEIGSQSVISEMLTGTVRSVSSLTKVSANRNSFQAAMKASKPVDTSAGHKSGMNT